MKELSIEDKAKAYDEAVINGSRLLESDIITRESYEYIFPELKESKDEKMMNQLHSWMKEFGGADEYAEKVYCWLKELIEKQGEKIPCDKGEPKFKVGDWVVNAITKKVEQVTEVTDHEYICSRHLIVSFDEQHLLKKWTIQDAKDGDVLATENFIFIFKNIDNGNGVHYYCHYEISKHEDDNQFGIALPQSLMGRVGNSISHYSPATKEQRDTLMKAMTDARYTFDFEKKELKKIKHDVQLTEFEEAVKDLMNDYRDAIGDNDATIEEVKKHVAYMLSLIHQNPAWSEEDENKKNDAITAIDLIMTDSYKETHPNLYKAFGEAKDFLKSLKNRYTWKPSDKQMYILEQWLKDNQYKGDARYCYPIVESLYQDLKKLREE